MDYFSKLHLYLFFKYMLVIGCSCLGSLGNLLTYNIHGGMALVPSLILKMNKLYGVALQ